MFGLTQVVLSGISCYLFPIKSEMLELNTKVNTVISSVHVDD